MARSIPAAIGVLLNNVSEPLAEQSRFADAMVYFGRATPIASAASPWSATYARTLNNAADALLGLGDTGRAEVLDRKALAIFETDPRLGHAWIGHASDQLGSPMANAETRSD